MPRSPNLDNVRIRVIVDLVRRLPGTPTWARIVRAIGEETGAAYTRQALQAHAPIKAAYDSRRRGDPAAPAGPRLSARARSALDRDARMREEIIELRRQLDAYHERFVRWAHNAHARGLTESIFERDLPPINRARARSSKRRRHSA